MRRIVTAALALLLLLVSACTPAARTELPRELRGPEVNAARQAAIGAADEDLRQLTDSAPLAANLDGCRDLRPRHAGFTWRCTVARMATVVAENADIGLQEQAERLGDLGCAAFPGLGTSRDELAAGVPIDELVEVSYHCPDRTIVMIRFSRPTDEDLAEKLDLTTLWYASGADNIVSGQPIAKANVDRLAADDSQELILVVAVIRTYWLTSP